jgi:hypothetical protein
MDSLKTTMEVKSSVEELETMGGSPKHATVGDAQLLVNNKTVLLPTPSADPHGTVNHILDMMQADFAQTASTFQRGGNG